MQSGGRSVAPQGSAGLLGRSHQRIGIVRMLGFFTDDAPQRSLHGLQKLHTPSLHQNSKDVFSERKGRDALHNSEVDNDRAALRFARFLFEKPDHGRMFGLEIHQ